ncbi:sodium:solute symporter family transporter [Runella salmonicolor]|uniref:Sodium:solute symporter n=1 Tax=Runella salmonicolor TaxID=2950278 RepID=A0ABT1FSR4_9BACT|nr:sodium:solute symporter [Runella salmonicolor]MCP1383522.1 sodium:solute symporter [Runella salmonicolor]
MDAITWQWVIMIGSSLLLFVVSPLTSKTNDFFKGSKDNVPPNSLWLTSSLVISWLFAKSITNAADLGYAFGFVGGVAYAGYYLSFMVAGVLIYQMRIKGKFRSIHHFLETRYGEVAVGLFSLLIGFRLINEIWSNTIIIGTYFGEQGSVPYFSSITVFTILTLAYTLKGGMRSSIFTDMIHLVLFMVLLVFILAVLIPQTPGGITTLASKGEWKMSQGLNLLCVAVLQSLSYPFHDPIMTDRGFIAPPRTTLVSFAMATVIGMSCIILFSFVGIFGSMKGLPAPATVEVAKLFGLPMALMMNSIMVTSAASTIDSTFSSSTKLIHLDLLKEKGISVRKGRITMVLCALFGTLPVFLNPEILSATTISGTMVLGLAPIFLFWWIKAPKWSFYGSVLFGIACGLTTIFVKDVHWIQFSEGKYADLLSINVVGTIGCFTLFFIPVLFKRK